MPKMHQLKIYVALLFFVGIAAFSQTAVIDGVLKSKANNQPIAYANIGVMGKNLGTVTDMNGKFSLLMDQNFDDSDIRISSIGYLSKTVKVLVFRKMLSESETIYLEKAVSELKEIIIKNKKLETAILGNTLGKKTVSAGFVNNVLGNEIGIKIKINKTQSPKKRRSLMMNQSRN